MTEPYRVMTVCTGNICRSPMAEVVLRDRLRRAGLAEDVVVDSTGISDEELGNPIDPRAERVLVSAGYDLHDHCARQVTADDVAARDLVVAMTSAHVRALRRMVGGAADVGRIRMYRSFDPDVSTDGPEHLLDVDDPWYGEESGFGVTLAEIEAAADGIIEHVRAALADRIAR